METFAGRERRGTRGVMRIQGRIVAPARETLVDGLDHLGLVEIADDGELRAIGGVEGLVEALHVIERDRLDVRRAVSCSDGE